MDMEKHPQRITHGVSAGGRASIPKNALGAASLRVSGCGFRFCFWGTRDRREAVSDEHRKKRKTSIHGACSANSAAKSRAVMIRVDL